MTQISIITCTYNSEKYLGECIQGVINQNINPSEFEHIFVDGKSSDTTIQIIQEYQTYHPDYNIQLIKAEPKGVYNAMNTGISHSNGEYVMFCNSDDYLVDGILSDYLTYIYTSKADIYYAQMNIIDDNKKIVSRIGANKIIRKLLFHLGFNVLVYHPTTCIKRTLFDELGNYDDTKKIASDYGFRLACISTGKKFVYYPHVITNFRYHTDSLTSNPLNKQREWAENLYFRKKYFGIWGIVIHAISLLLYRLKGKK